MTVAEMLNRMDASEIVEWAAFYSMSPFGHKVDNWRFGTIAATVANLFGREKDDPGFDWTHFFPDGKEVTKTPEGREVKEKSPMELMAVIQQLAARGLGRIKKKKKTNGSN